MIANWDGADEGPVLTAEKVGAESDVYASAKTALAETNRNKLCLYSLFVNREASGKYRVFVPTETADSAIYLYEDGNLTELERKETYGDGTAEVQIETISDQAAAPGYLVVADMAYAAEISADDGVDSLDVFENRKDLTEYVHADGTEATAWARNETTGVIDLSGSGQINFRVNVKDGYKIKQITVSDASHYKNLKTPAETGERNTYRVTKVTGELGISITTEQIDTAVGYLAERPR